jgi:hypothetical protein
MFSSHKKLVLKLAACCLPAFLSAAGCQDYQDRPDDLHNPLATYASNDAYGFGTSGGAPSIGAGGPIAGEGVAGPAASNGSGQNGVAGGAPGTVFPGTTGTGSTGSGMTGAGNTAGTTAGTGNR